MNFQYFLFFPYILLPVDDIRLKFFDYAEQLSSLISFILYYGYLILLIIGTVLEHKINFVRVVAMRREKRYR